MELKFLNKNLVRSGLPITSTSLPHRTIAWNQKPHISSIFENYHKQK